jgi:hypothetical protein
MPRIEFLPMVMDGSHCDPGCPHLKVDPEEPYGVRGRCALKDQELDWYDFYLALCVE